MLSHSTVLGCPRGERTLARRSGSQSGVSAECGSPTANTDPTEVTAMASARPPDEEPSCWWRWWWWWCCCRRAEERDSLAVSPAAKSACKRLTRSVCGTQTAVMRPGTRATSQPVHAARSSTRISVSCCACGWWVDAGGFSPEFGCESATLRRPRRLASRSSSVRSSSECSSERASSAYEATGTKACASASSRALASQSATTTHSALCGMARTQRISVGRSPQPGAYT
mmetsp:Transcript_2294/g.7302  ORF Transcript_2294/g.7302 Transcript_2294/m.7302 type:complete len:228 (+) Transcript_2294:412-1095(+)